MSETDVPPEALAVVVAAELRRMADELEAEREVNRTSRTY